MWSTADKVIVFTCKKCGKSYKRAFNIDDIIVFASKLKCKCGNKLSIMYDLLGDVDANKGIGKYKVYTRATYEKKFAKKSSF